MARVDLPGTDAYPGNSNRSRIEREQKEEAPKKDIKKVASGVKKKKSAAKKFKEAFVGDEGSQSVADYILYDVLVPAAKNTVNDMVTGGIEMLLFGERRGNRTVRDRGRSVVNYTSYSRRNGDRDSMQSRTSSRRSARDRVYNDDIILPSRGQAEEVIDSLLDVIDKYGSASVADLYSLVGIDSEFTDNSYGWTNLNNASVSRVRDGYALNLPRAYPID